jgi:iron complex outermembrane recepter protein
VRVQYARAAEIRWVVARVPGGAERLSGTTPAGIPKWSVSTSGTFSQPIGDSFLMYLRGEYDWASETQFIETVPADVSTFDQRSVNASLGLKNTPNRYEVMLWARNLTDHRTIIGAFPTVAQTGSYGGFPNEPRTYGITLRKRF